jgi:hypothetical protein
MIKGKLVLLALLTTSSPDDQPLADAVFLGIVERSEASQVRLSRDYEDELLAKSIRQLFSGVSDE